VPVALIASAILRDGMARLGSTESRREKSSSAPLQRPKGFKAKMLKYLPAESYFKSFQFYSNTTWRAISGGSAVSDDTLKSEEKLRAPRAGSSQTA